MHIYGLLRPTDYFVTSMSTFAASLFAPHLTFHPLLLSNSLSSYSHLLPRWSWSPLV